MLKFLIVIFVIIILIIGTVYAYYSTSLFIDFSPNASVTATFIAQGDTIVRRDADGRYVPIQLRGVELRPSIPGHMAWDFALTTHDYYRWFGYIDAMGANAIYAPNILDSNFYYAFYRFNRYNENPLLLLQGVAGDDYDSLSTNLKKAIDIIHGRRINFLSRTGIEIFLSNVSPWVVGIIVGAEWDPDSIIFTNHFEPAKPDSFQGEFFEAAEGASRFEVMLARVMDSATAYEARRFNVQRPIGFISNPIIDFLEFRPAYAAQLQKYAQLDHENVIPTQEMIAGTFAAYRLFYFTDDFLRHITESQYEALAPILATLDRSCIYNGYLDLLARYHTMPVIAAGFGFSSARAPYIMRRPPLTEIQQGHAMADMTIQLEARGWAGSFISSWQDTWERRTWNTSFSSDPWRYHYWHNLQSVDQGYGLMAFDPGAYERSVLIDGQADEWDDSHLVYEYGGVRIYAQYSLQGLYLLISGYGVNPRNTLYFPIDVTPRSGTSAFYNLEFERPADFLLVLSGRNNSRLLVNRRYDATRQRFYEDMTGINPFTHDIPPRWGAEFVPILVALQNPELVEESVFARMTDEAMERIRMGSWDTGRLTHGIGDPNSPSFNSLADFFFGENLVEIRLPWMLLNFFDPSTMRVHADYYERFGVEGLGVRQIYIGQATENGQAPMSPIPLQGWRNRVQTHERLKQSYFIMQELWGN